MTSFMFSDAVEKTPISEKPKKPKKTWRVLIVDDDDSVHQITRLVLSKIEIEGRGLELISATSAAEAKQILNEHDDIAMAFVDVVMESDTSGLDLVKWIRAELRNQDIRLILRTGQPGMAPEHSVIKEFDINDYKNKAELSSERLINSVYVGIRGYRDISTIKRSLDAFKILISSTNDLLKVNSINAFGSAALDNLLILMELDSSALYIARNQKDFANHEKQLIIACTGKYVDESTDLESSNISLAVKKTIDLTFQTKTPYIDKDCFVGYYETPGHGSSSVLYIEFDAHQEPFKTNLLELYASNVALILENLSAHNEIIQTQKEVMYIIGEAVEARSKETGNHVKRVALACELMAEKLRLPESFIRTIKLSAPLHDIGKVAIPDAILHKPGKLTPEEWEIMKSHAEIGGNMLKESDVGVAVMGSTVAFYHHENWDGSGYPTGMAGTKIPLEARIMAIVDVFDALGGRRSYKEPWPDDKIREVIIEEKGRKFDPHLVDIMIDNFDEFCQFKREFPD